jgi:pimeloyl-ACP methyl ester carboxylesterase
VNVSGDLKLDVQRHGSGPLVVLVHGSVVGASVTWRKQEPLAEHWTLCTPNRPGFGASPPLERGDFEAEAPLIAELLGDGAHLVGHSYGAVIALFAAALRPEAVWSLTVSEPGSLGVAAGNPAVDAVIADGTELFRRGPDMDPRDLLLFFRSGVGSAHHTPDELSGDLLAGAKLLMRERPPWEVDPPLEALGRAPFPKLVISGGHSEVFEAVCDAVADGIGGERAVIPGRGHSIPATGEPYNECLHAFLSAAETLRRVGDRSGGSVPLADAARAVRKDRDAS